MDATPHIIESALLLLATFLLGCVIGYFARRLSGPKNPVVTVAPTPVLADLAPVESVAAASPELLPEAPSIKPSRTQRPVSVKQTTPASRRKTSAASAASGPDDLKKIKGIGPRLEAALNAHGIDRYGQIAKWSKKTIAELDAELSLRGRIEREKWVEQAKALSKPEK